LTALISLKRAVTRWQIVGISLNSVVGSGVYLLPAAAAALLGPASLLAVPLAGLAVLLLALCFAEAGSHFDETGGAYVYTREAFGEFAGFQVGWMSWLTRVASGAALWNGFAQALTFVMPGAAAGATRVAVITVPLVVIAGVNVVGVKHGARLSVLLTIAKILPLLFLIAVGIPALDMSLVLPMPAPEVAGLGQAALLLLFAYAGFEITATNAGEFENPQRDVPFALIACIGIVTLLYTLIQLVALGTLPDLAARTAGTPLADSAVLVVGVWAGMLMTLGGTISIGGNAASTTFAGPRFLFALALDRFGPAYLTRVHPRFRTPAWAIVTQEALVWALALSGSFVQLAMLSVIARIVTYIGTAAAVPVLRKKLGTTEHTVVLPGGAAIPVLALLLCLAFIASATVWNLLAGLVAIAAGTVVYFLRRKTPHTGSAPGAY
jgi:basic amino acid/polyamine antiporter, APA family